MKKLYLFLFLAVSCLTMQAEETATVLEYTAPEWNDYPITFTVTDNCWSVNGTKIEGHISKNEQSTLTATVTVGENATLCYEPRYGQELQLIIDDNEIRSWNYSQLNNTQRKYCQALTSGEHTIKWVFTNNSSSYIYPEINNIGIETTPWITVNLLEPGSLGTEILYNVDHLKDVRNLKVIGSMNDDDWNKISMMKDNLFELDLSETDAKEITDERFNRWPQLHSIKLPEGLTKIGDRAFSDTYVLENINFPSTLESIGDWAFYYTGITSAILPEKCTSIGRNAFAYCRFLEEVKLSDALTTIKSYTFEHCNVLKTFRLPESLETIKDRAFQGCSLIAFTFPEALKTIKEWAFYQTNIYGEKSQLILPKNVSYIGHDAFADSKYTYAEMPVSFYTLKNGSDILPSTITTLRLNCPTVIQHPSSSDRIIPAAALPNITLQVPSFLVNSYKLDDYWYDFGKIEGFSTAEIDEWVINSNLVLGARDRLEGTPSVKINCNGSLKINGTDGMTIENLCFVTYPNSSTYGQMFSNADDVVVNGKLWNEFRAGTANQWYFISMPYNVKVSDITSESTTAKRAIRYYDGANRAEHGATGSWKDFEESDIIPAGTGFILQANETSWWTIPAMEDESKQFLTSNNMFAKKLAANPSESTSNKGWNLVGNPYQCWYNIHKLNFTAPITVRDMKNNTYQAYSVIDDDFALAPSQAFFVQCPEGISDISFPLEGRQTTSVIESQSGVKPYKYFAPRTQRTLIDLSISNDNFSDRTRIVFNNTATTDYDTGCDAGKFFSESQDVPQIYSYDSNNNKYAINERPEGNGNVKLGFIAPESGRYTISLTRSNAKEIMLKDNETGTAVNISEQSYTFTADAGTDEKRFELYMAETTGIDSTAGTQQTLSISTSAGEIHIYNLYDNVEVFALSGAKVGRAKVNGNHTFSLPSGIYIVNGGNKTMKVIVP